MFAQKAVIVASVVVSLLMLVMVFAMFVGAVKLYYQVACNTSAAVNAVLGTEFMKTTCEVAGGGSGGGRASGGYLSTNCGGSAQALVIKTDYLNWTNDAANFYLKDETAKYFPDGQPIAILEALINVESRWKPTSHNASSGATGLGQFLYSTAVGRPEFVGGSALKTFPKGNLYNTNPLPSDDARYDAQRSIYATANYFKNRINSTNGACGSKKGLERFTCAYAYGYNGGCNPSIANKITPWDKNKTYCQVATEAANLMAKYYEQYVGGGTGINCSSVRLAEQTAKDVEALDGGAFNKNMTTKKSAYARGRSWSVNTGSIPWYADCADFVGYAMRNTMDRAFPANGTAVQFNYVKNHPEKYDMVPIKRPADAIPGDVLAMGSCTDINKCTAGHHTNIYIGNGKVVSASLDEHGPIIQNWYSDMGVAYRLK